MTIPDLIFSRPQDREMIALLVAIVAVGVFVGGYALLLLRVLFLSRPRHREEERRQRRIDRMPAPQKPRGRQHPTGL